MASYQIRCYLSRYSSGYLEVVTDRGDVETYYVYSSDWAAFDAWIERSSEWFTLWVDEKGYVQGWQ